MGRRRKLLEPVEPWTTGQRGHIVYDRDHGLAFIREPGGVWDAYWQEDTVHLRRFYVTSYTDLSRARHQTLKAIGQSIGEFVMKIHPHADRTHVGRWNGKLWVHLCGVAFTEFRSVAHREMPTCPVCLASLREDLDAAVKAIDAAELAVATEHVRTVRAVNALGQAVNGEDAIDRL